MQNYNSKVKIKDGISVLTVKNQQEGSRVAKEILYENVDSKTALFLSGGSTPKPLYQNLAKEKRLKVGAVAMVDERYFSNEELRTKNEKLRSTNEKMIKDTGLLDYFRLNNFPLYGILRNKSLEETVRDYDKLVQNLFNKFPKKVAVLGIGEDGHTASLPAGKTQNSKLKTQKFAISIDNFPGEFRERISLTFHALSKMDLLIALVFGKEKRKALKLLFSEGSIAEVPARFLKQPKVAHKTLLITDQKI